MSSTDIPDVIDLLADLVSIDSSNPGGNEKAVAELLGQVFTSHGLDVTIDTYDADHVNLIAVADFGPGPEIMLNSHLDVVPTPGHWTTPPFTPDIRDGRLYGRGAADAKGSLAPMAVALLNLLDQRSELSGRIVYTGVGDEEVGSGGARHLLKTWQPDAAIVGEPTGLRLLTAHKGSVRPIVEIVGRSAHAAAPEKGINSIEALGDLFPLLREYRNSLDARTHTLTGAPTSTVVLIEGGEAPNAVPASCRITIDRRLIPGETADEAVAELEIYLDKFNALDHGAVARVAHRAPSTGGPSQTDVTDPFVTACQDALRGLDLDPRPGGLLVNCDMTHFRSSGIPTVVLGPGELEAMHVPNESVRVQEVREAVLVYDALLRSGLARL